MTYVVPADFSTRSQLGKADDLFKSLNLRVQINKATLAAVQNAQLQEALGNKLIGEKVAPTNAERVEDKFSTRASILSELVKFTKSNKVSNEIYQQLDRENALDIFKIYFPKFKEEFKSMEGVDYEVFMRAWHTFLPKQPIGVPIPPQPMPVERYGEKKGVSFQLGKPTRAGINRHALRDLPVGYGDDEEYRPNLRQFEEPIHIFKRQQMEPVIRYGPVVTEEEEKAMELGRRHYEGPRPEYGSKARAAHPRIPMGLDEEEARQAAEAIVQSRIAATKTKFIESVKDKPLIPFNKAFNQLEELDAKYGLDNIPPVEIDDVRHLVLSVLKNGPLRNMPIPDDIYTMSRHELADKFTRIKMEIEFDPALSKFLVRPGNKGQPKRHSARPSVVPQVTYVELKDPMARSNEALESLNELDEISYGLGGVTDEEVLNTARGFLREFIENNPFIKDQGIPPGLDTATGEQILNLKDQALRMIESQQKTLQESDSKEVPVSPLTKGKIQVLIDELSPDDFASFSGLLPGSAAKIANVLHKTKENIDAALAVDKSGGGTAAREHLISDLMEAQKFFSDDRKEDALPKFSTLSELDTIYTNDVNSEKLRSPAILDEMIRNIGALPLDQPHLYRNSAHDKWDAYGYYSIMRKLGEVPNQQQISIIKGMVSRILDNPRKHNFAQAIDKFVAELPGSAEGDTKWANFLGFEPLSQSGPGGKPRPGKHVSSLQSLFAEAPRSMLNPLGVPEPSARRAAPRGSIFMPHIPSSSTYRSSSYLRRGPPPPPPKET
jgi:hypothetical protein